MRFRKYHSLGNDYIVLEAGLERVTAELLRRVCDRHRGVGSDGVLIETAAVDADAGVRVFNPDGSEAETSGNGLRIFARYLHDLGRVGGVGLRVRTLAGVAVCDVLDGGRRVRVAMGCARFDADRSLTAEGFGVDDRAPGVGRPDEAVDLPLGDAYPTGWRYTAVSLGNPHVVVQVVGPTAELAQRWGPAIERDPRFPNRTNVQFVELVAVAHLRVAVWERGAGLTEASGSSACAAAAATRRLGRCAADVVVTMPGGDLTVTVGEDFEVAHTGPVAAVAQGALAAELVAAGPG